MKKRCAQIIDIGPYMLGGYYHPRDKNGDLIPTERQCSRWATENQHCWQHARRGSL